MPLALLAELGQGQLPVGVTRKADLKSVSVLKAAGMIDTALVLSESDDRYYREIEAALIFAITQVEMKKIRAMIAMQPAVPANSMERKNLAQEYLRVLDNSDLPARVSVLWTLDCVQTQSCGGSPR